VRDHVEVSRAKSRGGAARRQHGARWRRRAGARRSRGEPRADECDCEHR